MPIGVLFMLPLFALPLGAWLVQKGWIVFGLCGLKLTLGIPCLTCGSTRATIHLLHGNVLSALQMQPLIILVYGSFALWGVISLASFAVGRTVHLDFGAREHRFIKIALVATPFLNWAYLIAAGI